VPAPRGEDSSTSTSWCSSTRAQLRDPTAFGRLVSRCLPHLKRWAHRRLPRWVRSAGDTSDLIQDAALRTLRNLETLDLRSNEALSAYLREAVRNRIRDQHRSFARRGRHDAASEALIDPAPSPLDEALASERQAQYRAALSRLRPQDRELIVAHIELDYTHEQLGCMTGRSRNAARMALERAIRRLAEQMRDA
jgi:RNA polymerase sigma factor (sigma-70 family)